MEKSIREQIKDQHGLHCNYFACLGLAILCFYIGFRIDDLGFLRIVGFQFLAADMIIAAIIDVNKK